MTGKIMTMLTETNLHVGSGRSTSAVDLPFYREQTTDYPSIPGSSLKGALRSLAREMKLGDQTDRIFGSENGVGTLSLSDARLLLLPVRSLTSNYKWLTCKFILERFVRDLNRTRNPEIRQALPNFYQAYQNLAVEEGTYIGNCDEPRTFLEELEFEKGGKIDEAILNFLRDYLPTGAKPGGKDRLKDQLVILSDDDFKWFANYGLNIVSRNSLEEGTKKSKGLWYEEYVSPDTLFYAVIHSNSPDSQKTFQNMLEDRWSYFQLGANESIGQGWISASVIENKVSSEDQ